MSCTVAMSIWGSSSEISSPLEPAKQPTAMNKRLQDGTQTGGTWLRGAPALTSKPRDCQFIQERRKRSGPMAVGGSSHAPPADLATSSSQTLQQKFTAQCRALPCPQRPSVSSSWGTGPPSSATWALQHSRRGSSIWAPAQLGTGQPGPRAPTPAWFSWLQHSAARRNVAPALPAPPLPPAQLPVQKLTVN